MLQRGNAYHIKRVALSQRERGYNIRLFFPAPLAKLPASLI